MNALLFLALTAFAQSDEPEGELYGNVRIIGSQLSDFAVDAEGTTIDQNAWLDMRLRIGATMPFFIGELDTEWEVNAPQLIGDKWAIPGFIDARRRDALTLWILPRKLNVTGYLANYQVSAGLTTSHWGLGMLANDGAHPDWWGRSDFGDRVIRLRATRLPYSDGPAKPISMYTTAALDLVVNDELSELEDGQISAQAILSLLWKSRSENEWGVYSVFRYQVERDRTRTTSALAVDAFGDFHWDINQWTLRAAGEAAAILGSTNRATTYNSTHGQTVLQFGATALAELSSPNKKVTFRLRGAYATADGNPDDGVTHDFTFDRDFSAGIVLFDQLQGGIEAATYNRLTDPDIAGQPPDAVDALVTEGSFRRATFIQPAIELRPIPWAAARVGATLSWSNGPVTQPFYTYRAGGSPRNHLNAKSEGYDLGTELNWSLVLDNLGPHTDRNTTLEFQIGHLFVGDTLTAGGGEEVIHHGMAIFRKNW